MPHLGISHSTTSGLLIPATHPLAVRAPSVRLTEMETPNAGASPATAPTRIQSPAASLNVNEILTAEWDLFVGHTDVLRSRILVSQTLAALVPGKKIIDYITYPGGWVSANLRMK